MPFTIPACRIIAKCSDSGEAVIPQTSGPARQVKYEKIPELGKPTIASGGPTFERFGR